MHLTSSGIENKSISNFGPVHGIENRGGAESRKGNDWNGGHEV